MLEKHTLIVGLGNPGRQYEFTRHNMGFLVVQALAQSYGWQFKEDKQFRALIAKGKVGNATVHLLLPLTYMNESGLAVRRYLDFYKLTADDVIVVTDDIALLYGEMRVRAVGSAGGHNGLKSIQTHLNSSHYLRLRMGIDHQKPEQKPEGQMDFQQRGSLADYVLDKFSLDEITTLPSFVESGVKVLKRLISEDVAAVMNTVNTKQQGK